MGARSILPRHPDAGLSRWRQIEPLGKSYSRKYTYPDVISKDPGFSFGLGGSRSIHETAAAAVCPPEAPSLSATEDQVPALSP